MLTKPLKSDAFVMTARTRDTLALFAIATAAILSVLYADADLAGLLVALLGS